VPQDVSITDILDLMRFSDAAKASPPRRMAQQFLSPSMLSTKEAVATRHTVRQPLALRDANVPGVSAPVHKLKRAQTPGAVQFEGAILLNPDFKPRTASNNGATLPIIQIPTSTPTQKHEYVHAHAHALYPFHSEHCH
jgi:hypothetical protein